MIPPRCTPRVASPSEATGAAPPPPQPSVSSSASLTPLPPAAAAGRCPCRAMRGWRWRLLLASPRRMNPYRVGFPGVAAARPAALWRGAGWWRGDGVAVCWRWRLGAVSGWRRHPGLDLGPLGLIWVRAGRFGLCRVGSGWTEGQLVTGVAATVPCLLQRDGGSFTGPFWARPGRLTWCAPADASGLLLPTAVEVVPSHVDVVLPPLV